MTIPLSQIRSMPAFSPYFPTPPALYRNVRIQSVYFRASLDAIDRVLPECFEPSESGECAVLGLTVPWSSNYGAFEESVLSVQCVHEGEQGWFTPVVFVNSKSSIPAGREIYGTPKVHADFETGFAERVVYTNTMVGGATVISMRSTIDREVTEAEMPTTHPAWRLKVIPRVDGKGLDVMQLIDVTTTTTDQVVHVRRAGDGVVRFDPVPTYDLSDFAPLEYLGAYYVEMDMTENWGEIVKDFLAEDPTLRSSNR